MLKSFGVFVPRILTVAISVSLAGCTSLDALQTNLSADTIATTTTETALTGALMEAFETNQNNVRVFKATPTEDERKRFLLSGFTLTDIYCDRFFRQVNAALRKRKFGRSATNDVGTAIAAVLGLASVGAHTVSGVATGFGLADSTWRNYDDSFVVSPNLDVVRSIVLAAQDEFRSKTLNSLPEDYMTARSAIIRYAGLCSYLGMQSLLNHSVDDQRRQLQDAAKPAATVVAPAPAGAGKPPAPPAPAPVKSSPAVDASSPPSEPAAAVGAIPN